MCEFLEAWRGLCKQPTNPGSRFCEKHDGLMCMNKGCSNQAIAECANTFQFVCGWLYCEECGRHIGCR